MNWGLILFTANFFLGITVWGLPSALSGWAPAWEGDAYFVVGLPLVILSCAGSTWLEPDHSWRWPVGSVLGQFLAMLVGSHFTPLLIPYALLFLFLIHLPAFLVAAIISWSQQAGVLDPDDGV